MIIEIDSDDISVVLLTVGECFNLISSYSEKWMGDEVNPLVHSAHKLDDVCFPYRCRGDDEYTTIFRMITYV